MTLRTTTLLLVLALAGCPPRAALPDAGPQVSDVELFEAIDQLRTPDSPAQPEQNLAGAHRTLTRVPTRSAPVLREALETELPRPKPDLYFLMRGAQLLLELDPATGSRFAVQLLPKLDLKREGFDIFLPSALLVAHAAARTGASTVPAQLDRLFLENDQPFTYRGSEVSPLQACLFTYGSIQEIETHLLAELQRKHPRGERILELLRWVGSPDSAPVVAELAKTTQSDTTYELAALYLHTMGGAYGKLALETALKSRLSPARRAILARLAPELSKQTPEAAAAAVLERSRKDPRLPDLQQALAQPLPARVLIRQLSTARVDALRNLTLEALPYVEQINLAIQAVGLRPR